MRMWIVDCTEKQVALLFTVFVVLLYDRNFEKSTCCSKVLRELAQVRTNVRLSVLDSLPYYTAGNFNWFSQ